MGIASVVQFKPDLALDVPTLRSNVRKMDKFKDILLDSGTELVLFPELCYCGYNYLSSEEAWLVASPNDTGSGFTYFASLAKELDAYVAYGFIEAFQDCLYNSANLIDPGGHLISTSRKCHLWGNDFLWATSWKDRNPIVETSLGLTATMICNDLTKAMASPVSTIGSFDSILAPCNWNTNDFPNENWMRVAQSFNCNVLISNRWGKELNGGHVLDFGQGGSCIIDRENKVHIDGIGWNDDCVITARI